MKKIIFILLVMISFIASGQNKLVILIDEFQINSDSSYIKGSTFFQQSDGRLVPTQNIILSKDETCDTCVLPSSEIKYLLGVRDSIINTNYEEYKKLLKRFDEFSLRVHQDTLTVKGSDGLYIKIE